MNDDHTEALAQLRAATDQLQGLAIEIADLVSRYNNRLLIGGLERHEALTLTLAYQASLTSAIYTPERPPETPEDP